MSLVETLPSQRRKRLTALLVSFFAVTLAEIGDKTQLLALILAARFRRPFPIIAGILVATLANHAIAADLGSWLAGRIPEETLNWLAAVLFVAMGLWILVPDREDEAEASYRFGPFLTTLITFFLAEIGDKTQIATVVLALEYQAVATVVVGTTIGMLAANVPAVLAGHLTADRLPLRAIRVIAATVFVALGAFAYFTGAAPSPLPAPTQLE